jgi:hypothetical protein
MRSIVGRLRREFVKRCSRADVVADLAGGHDETQRTAVGVGNGMELGVHAAFGAADQACKIPLFSARLEAVRCAFK